ncbi:MAG TPA: thiamine-phosphate kinase [Acidimicrobiales bacterium]|nr:thiamine-phosphate kinase [Acidimicrobiales bacterium]
MSADPQIGAAGLTGGTRELAGAGSQPAGGESEALARLEQLLPVPPAGQVWFGDDAAVVAVPGSRDGSGSTKRLLLASDCLVAGMDADLRLTSLADLGWKAMAVNLSDIAAMGGRPSYALVSVVGLKRPELEELYSGILEAASRYACPVVGGDLSGGHEGVVSVAVVGWVDGAPVLRNGASAGDAIWVTGELGAAAAGLRLLKEGGSVARSSPLARAHARPVPHLVEGEVARAMGATAMIDVSDGLTADLGKLAASSGVGFELSRAELPIARGATLEEALGGGDDYVLVLTARRRHDVAGAFYAAGLPPPYMIGTCTGVSSEHLLDGRPLPALGWEHEL